MANKSKTAETSVPVHPIIAERWSPRAFLPKVPDPEQLTSLFEAARWTPSSANSQPWRFLVGIKGEGESFDRIFDCLDEGNRRWAHLAPVLGIGIAQDVDDKGKKLGWARHDLGQAMATLTFQASHVGLFVHQMAGFSAEDARQTFDIPAEFAPRVAFAIGYLGEPALLTEERDRAREVAPRTRIGLNEFVFSGKFGQPSPIAKTERE